MAGKMTDGTLHLWDMKQVSAYAEGVEARINAAIPVNPHAAGTPENVAWARGSDDITTGASSVDACVAVGGRSAAA